MNRLIQQATRIFQDAQIHRPRWTAEQLLAARLGLKPIDLYLEQGPVPLDESIGFQADVAARAAGVPLQYLTGQAGFYGRDFQVGPGVFIPRPETEILVKVAMEVLEKRDRHLFRTDEPCQEREPVPLVMDVGTGSGAIAITLALENKGIRVIGVEISPRALAFAQENVLSSRASVSLLQGDLLTSFAFRSADLIVANLPYLDVTQAPSWPPELSWEPSVSLDGGPDGLRVICRLLRQARFVLKRPGTLVLEMGEGQQEALCRLGQESGFTVQRVVPDLAGLPRVMVLWKSW